MLTSFFFRLKVRLKDLKFEFCQFKLELAKIRSSSTSAQVCFYNTTHGHDQAGYTNSTFIFQPLFYQSTSFASLFISCLFSLARRDR